MHVVASRCHTGPLCTSAASTPFEARARSHCLKRTRTASNGSAPRVLLVTRPRLLLSARTGVAPTPRTTPCSNQERDHSGGSSHAWTHDPVLRHTDGRDSLLATQIREAAFMPAQGLHGACRSLQRCGICKGFVDAALEAERRGMPRREPDLPSSMGPGSMWRENSPKHGPTYSELQPEP